MMPIQDYYKYLFKWLSIREEHGIEFPTNVQQLQIYMMKSALLNRLIEGKDPLPYPPPLSFSYPWYSLMETGEANIIDLWEDSNLLISNGPVIMIHQFPWKILQKIDEDSWLVTYEYISFNKPVTAEGTWHVYKDTNSWVIKKLNE